MPSKNDAADFQALRSAMQVLNFSQTECDTVFKILASVLHLGNIRFKSKQVEYQAEGVVVERESEVRWAAHLLEIPDTGIISALTTKTTVMIPPLLWISGGKVTYLPFCRKLATKSYWRRSTVIRLSTRGKFTRLLLPCLEDFRFLLHFRPEIIESDVESQYLV